MSDEVIGERFGGTRPKNFAELQAGLGEGWAAVAIQTFGSTNSGQVLREEDLGSIWDNLVQDKYGVPEVASEAKGIWSWGDVSYIVVQQNAFSDYDLEGTVTYSRTEERIEYHADGFWWDGKFTPWSVYDPDIHGENRDNLPHARQMLGVVEERDGFIEIRDANWNVIGRFADPTQAEGLRILLKATRVLKTLGMPLRVISRVHGT